MKSQIKVLAAALPVVFIMLMPTWAQAEIKIEVSGNGTNANNSVQVEAKNETVVEQTNTAAVENKIAEEAKSGENTATGNSTQAQKVTTGEATTEVKIDTIVNTSVINAESCCEKEELNIVVTGNGNNSVNTVQASVKQKTTIRVTQVAKVENQVDVSTNTGENTAAYNSGPVTITTGKASVIGAIANVVNQEAIDVAPGSWDIHVINTNNGANSLNVVRIDYLDSFVLWNTNRAQVDNDVYARINTGENQALGNLNDVFVMTGDAEFNFLINNAPVNSSTAMVWCCDDGAPSVPVDPHPNPQDYPGTLPTGGQTNSESKSMAQSAGGSHHGKTTGEVLGALADSLPATGAAAFHFWILAVVYLITFLTGLYVRLRAGRSPSFASRYAYAQ